MDSSDKAKSQIISEGKGRGGTCLSDPLQRGTASLSRAGCTGNNTHSAAAPAPAPRPHAPGDAGEQMDFPWEGAATAPSSPTRQPRRAMCAKPQTHSLRSDSGAGPGLLGAVGRKQPPAGHQANTHSRSPRPPLLRTRTAGFFPFQALLVDELEQQQNIRLCRSGSKALTTTGCCRRGL